MIDRQKHLHEIERHEGDSTHKQVLAIRTDLGMNVGKMGAQLAHAAVKALFNEGYVFTPVINSSRFHAIPLDEHIGPWHDGLFAKICCALKDEDELWRVFDQAVSAGIPCSVIQDSQLSLKHKKKVYTIVAVGPALIETIDKITGNLPLLR